MGVKIGGVEIPGLTALAPLAGVTDRSFRLLCREQGASFAVTEMVSARGLAEGSERSSQFLDFEPDEVPISAQVFGSEPDIMAEGARVVGERKPDIIDINCGCPVKKVVNRKAGAALLKEDRGTGAQGMLRVGRPGADAAPAEDAQWLSIERAKQELSAEQREGRGSWPRQVVAYLPGSEYSVDVLCDAGDVLAGVVRLRLASRGGLATDSVVVDDADVRDAAHAVVRRPRVFRHVRVTCEQRGA